MYFCDRHCCEYFSENILAILLAGYDHHGSSCIQFPGLESLIIAWYFYGAGDSKLHFLLYVAKRGGEILSFSCELPYAWLQWVSVS